MDFMKYLPSFYYGSEEVQNIQTSLQAESQTVKNAIIDLLDQIFVGTATWGLEYWERYLGLRVDLDETNENRRARILTKLRGHGVVTTGLIKNVCESFDYGTVEVTESPETYSFKIKFVDSKGIPGNIAYLEQAINEIKPAHLSFAFEYKFNTWNMVSTDGETWNDYESQSKTWYGVSVI